MNTKSTVEAKKFDISQFLPPVPKVPQAAARVKSPKLSDAPITKKSSQPAKALKTGTKEPVPPMKGRPGRKRQIAHETPRERSMRIGKRRMKTTLTAIRRIGNLSSRYYDFQPSDVALMFSTLKEGLKDAENRFAAARSGEQRAEERFDFFSTVSSH